MFITSVFEPNHVVSLQKGEELLEVGQPCAATAEANSHSAC